jgi:hypothetical protein
MKWREKEDRRNENEQIMTLSKSCYILCNVLPTWLESCLLLGGFLVCKKWKKKIKSVRKKKKIGRKKFFCSGKSNEKLTGKSVLFTHGGDNGNKEFLALVEFSLQLLTKFTFGQLDIILGGTVVKHQGEETIINIDKGILVADDVGNIHVVSGGREIFELPIQIET